MVYDRFGGDNSGPGADVARAGEMLSALKVDFKLACASPSRECGHITLDAYRAQFGVRQEAALAYCASLPRLVPSFPACMICGAAWSHVNDIAQPVSNGHVIDWVDCFTVFCANEAHDTLWYDQSSDGHASFTREVGEAYEVRWNCNCMVAECFRRNVIYTHGDYDAGDPGEMLALNHTLAYDASREEIDAVARAFGGAV